MGPDARTHRVTRGSKGSHGERPCPKEGSLMQGWTREMHRPLATTITPKHTMHGMNPACPWKTFLCLINRVFTLSSNFHGLD